jgi:hypothetical protein
VTKSDLNSAIDNLGEEIASDINDLEILVKTETSKIEQLQTDVCGISADGMSTKIEISKIMD